MIIKDLTKMNAKQIEEKLTNRSLLNFGYIIMAYPILYCFYLYAMGRLGNILTYKYVMFGLFIAFAIATAALYALSFSKLLELLKLNKLEKYIVTFRNYAHMALAITLSVFYLNLPFYTRWLPIETSPSSLRPILMFLKNTQSAYYVVAALMFVYLVFTTVYHSVLIRKYTKSAKKASKTK